MLCETHVHSRYSDGLSSVESILKKAEKKNIGALSITDHNTMKGYEQLKKLLHKFILIPGCEITSDARCHILSLGIEEFPGKNLPIEEVIDFIHERGGLAIAAHPFKKDRAVPERYFKKFDALEVISGNVFPSTNRKALDFASKNHLSMISGSDAHLTYDIGRFAFRIEADSIDELLNNIKKGKAVLPKSMPSYSYLLFRKTGANVYRKIAKKMIKASMTIGVF
jgi:predicted metal-dependent phosphoesterase TrpH